VAVTADGQFHAFVAGQEAPRCDLSIRERFADQAKYEDYSPMLRDILSRGLREARAKAAKA